MAPHRWAVLLVILLAPLIALAGEIIFVDPVREKVQSLPSQPESQRRGAQAREDVRRDGRGASAGSHVDAVPTPAEVQSQNARGYLEDDASPPPPVLMKNTDQPAEATRMRQAARNWTAPASRRDTRCTTENTVGSIDGAAQGHTVVQGVGGSVVNIQCK